MFGLARLTVVAALAAAAALPAAPAAAHDSSCFDVIGGTTLVDVAYCVALSALPPEVAGQVHTLVGPVLREPAVRCAIGDFGRCDAFVCAHLITLAPGVPGVVDVRPEGDVYIAGAFIWDCPPYAA